MKKRSAKIEIKLFMSMDKLKSSSPFRELPKFYNLFTKFAWNAFIVNYFFLANTLEAIAL